MQCSRCKAISQFSAKYKCLNCGTINKPDYTRFGNGIVTIKRKDGKIVEVRSSTIRVS